MENNVPKVVCFGEVLWDVFPDKRLLGGAPLNVANRLHQLGAEALMLSSVGNDDPGKEVLSQLDRSGLSSRGISISEYKPTGTVQVSLRDGIASYRITDDVAWDHIKIQNDMLEEVLQADALVFGSLALRHEHNLKLLESLLDNSVFAIFDLNLRPPFYTDELLSSMMMRADLIKLNDEELEYVCNLLQIDSKDLETQVREIAKKTGTRMVCVTLGDRGAVLLRNEKYIQRKGYKVAVADTVGAGDSFFAALIYELLSGSSAEDALAKGCALGALVASKTGANCEVTPAEIHLLMNS